MMHFLVVFSCRFINNITYVYNLEFVHNIRSQIYSHYQYNACLKSLKLFQNGVEMYQNAGNCILKLKIFLVPNPRRIGPCVTFSVVLQPAENAPSILGCFVLSNKQGTVDLVTSFACLENWGKFCLPINYSFYWTKFWFCFWLLNVMVAKCNSKILLKIDIQFQLLIFYVAFSVSIDSLEFYSFGLKMCSFGLKICSISLYVLWFLR